MGIAATHQNNALDLIWIPSCKVLNHWISSFQAFLNGCRLFTDFLNGIIFFFHHITLPEVYDFIVI